MGIPLKDIKDFDQLAYQLAINPTFYAGKASKINKFGYNLDIDSTKADVWAAGGTKTDRDSSDFGIVEVVSDDVNDTAGGSGAQAVSIFGYDADGNFTSDWQELNGTTAVELDLKMWDVYRGIVTSAGSGTYNAGTITVRHKTGPVTLASIPAGFNQTQMSQFMIPKGKTAFFMGGKGGIGGVQGAGGIRIGDLHFEVMSRGCSWRMTETFGGTSNSGAIPLEFAFPPKYPELTKLKFSCTSETDNTRAYVEYDLALIDNDYIV